jgi:hypothetical protein
MTPEPLPPPPPPPPQAPQPQFPNNLALGVAIAIGCDVVLCALTAAIYAGAIFAFGLIQWIVLLPIYLIARKQGARNTAKGVMIVGAIVFLLQAACWGLIAVIGFNVH